MPKNTGPAKKSESPPQDGRGFLARYGADIVVIVLLFAISWMLRSLYQSESVTMGPLRADAGKYSRAAIHLKRWGVFSIDKATNEPPQSWTDLSPGYPIYLSVFLDPKASVEEFVTQVRRSQAVMGALVVVLTYLIARQGLSVGWSALAGILTSLNPHLIAISDYILTESLYTFVMTCGVLIVALAWRSGRLGLVFLGTVVLGLSAEVRAVGYAMPFFLGAIYLVRPDKRAWAARKTWMFSLAAIVAGFLCVLGAKQAFIYLTVTSKPGLAEPPKKFTHVKTPWAYLQRTIRPPNFYVTGAPLVGTDNPDRNWKEPTTASFSDEPSAYLRWSLYGKLRTMWCFDNVYNGDVYIYPMVRKGFEHHALLQTIHIFFRLMHWPLFMMALGTVVALAVATLRGTVPMRLWALWVPALGLVYFLAVLYVVSWLPRYTIPVRGFSYILVAAGLSWFVAWQPNEQDKSGG